ncbi:hypothetical protein ACG2F4_04420 [Halalkalibaculum sp. DA3122]|uniref:hypothetical protein n=1 Tax=Halalkalibaculum sp. DA3122 TaxID=3373607 RepID=UPI003753FC34
MDSGFEDIRETLNSRRSELMSKPNVVATGIGYKVTNGRQTEELSIICSVELKKPKKRLTQKDLIPAAIHGIPTDVLPSGPFVARQDPKGRFRPAPGGVSIGHFDITAGTLGCLVKKDDTIYILSNNHVLANSNEADIGDAILQPGPYDGGQNPQDQIAKLSEFVPISFDGEGENGSSPGCFTSNMIASVLNSIASTIGSSVRMRPYRVQTTENLVDAAIAEPLTPSDLENEILQIGTIAGTREAELGMEIKKSGRTTGFTTGTIQQVDVTARVNYGANKVATFVDQLVAGSMSQGGDSGSAVLDNENNLVGLLFAGSDTSTIINRIDNVFNSLDVTLP